MIYFLSALAAFLLAFLLSWRLSNPESSLYVLDHPNHRSMHDEPQPRNGGIAILSGFSLGLVIAWLMMNDIQFSGGEFLLTGLVLVVIISFLDDKYSLPSRLRFLVQTCAAILLMVGGFALSELVIPGMGSLPLGWLSLPLSLLFVVWMMNLYNFMDGMNGFSGGMGVFGFGFLALLGWMAGSTLFCATALLLAAANLGFLLHNFPAPNARIFMGDVGSVPMGFLAASLTLWGVRDGIFDLWVALLLFSPFIVDATITVIRRGLMEKKVWVAHHSHYYQRLVRFGWKHKKTVLYEYVLMAGCGGLAIFLKYSENEIMQAIGLIVCCIVYIVLAILVDKETASIKWD